MQILYKTILLTIVLLSITTSLFALEQNFFVLYLRGEITGFTVVSQTESGLEISSNVLGFSYQLVEDDRYTTINLFGG